MHTCPCHHPTPNQRKPQVKAGSDHVKQHPFDVVLTGIGEKLQEDATARWEEALRDARLAMDEKRNQLESEFEQAKQSQ